MIRTIYYCDWCQIEIGERCKRIFHQVKYDDEYGEDLHTDWHFCSALCEKNFKEKDRKGSEDKK
jgi:hypothetical protein